MTTSQAGRQPPYGLRPLSAWPGLVWRVWGSVGSSAVPVEFLSDAQVARFGRFAADPSPLELERFFRLDADGLRLVGDKRRDENRLGFAVQWGTVRMLGMFLSEDPTGVPSVSLVSLPSSWGSRSRCACGCTPSGQRRRM